MKRIIQNVICICISSMLCVGCAMNKNTTITKSEDKIVLHWMLAGEKSLSSDSVLETFNTKLKEYLPNVTVEFEFIELNEYQESWDMKMATNETLDLIWISSDIFNYTEEVNKGGFTALDYLLSTHGQGLMEKIPQELWDIQKRDNKIYSVPIQGAMYRKDYALVTQKGLLKTYGNMDEISEVNTGATYTNKACFDVIEDYLYNLKEAKKIGTGVSCDTFSYIAQKGYEGIYGSDSPFVIRIFDDDLAVYNKYEEESYRSYFQTMSEWYQKGYIREDIKEVLNPQEEIGATAGNVIFLDEDLAIEKSLNKIHTDYEAESIALQNYKYISWESCRNAIAIPRTTKYPQEAMELIQLLNSEKGEGLIRLLGNGFEGRHYVKISAKEDLIDRITDTKGNVLYAVSPNMIGDTFLNYESSVGEFEQIQKYNEEAFVSPLMGFELDTRMIVLELEKIDLIVHEEIERLENGTEENWEIAYEEMIEKMNKAGAQKVIDEIERQLRIFEESKDTNV